MRVISDKQRRAMFANMGSSDNKFSYSPLYVPADIPAMGVDAAGTAGATAVSMVPLLTTLGIGFIGADMVLKTKERLGKQWHEEKSASKKKRSRFSRDEAVVDYYDYGDSYQYEL